MRTPVCCLLLTLAACSFRGSYVNATFRDPAVGQARLETLDDERIGVATYKDGQLSGAEAARFMTQGWAADWIDRREAVDHPSLPVWKQLLSEMRRHAGERAADPTPLLRAAAAFPFSDARHECVEQWVGGESERAAQLLDRYRLLDPGATMASGLAAQAMQLRHGDDRTARWVVAMAADNHRDAALVVVRSPHIGPLTATATLRDLDSFSSSVRRELFDAVAPHARSDADAAFLLVEAVDELVSSEEAPAMLLVLRAPDADPELGHRVLAAIDDFRSADRAPLLLESARLVAGDTRGADAVVAALGELRSSQRFGAARQLMLRTSDPELVAGLLRAIDDLPSRDRPRLIEAALRQSHWTESIERAARDAVDEVRGRSARARIAAAVEAHVRSFGG